MKRQRGSTDIIVLVLILSIGANLWLWNRVKHFREEATVAKTNLTHANSETKTCNNSIAGIKAEAFERGVLAGKDRAQAKVDRDKKRAEAKIERDTPAAVPGDDCASAQARVSRILKARTQ